MNPTKWQEIKNLINLALELPVEQRAEFLAHGTDEEIRLEAEKLLLALDQAEDFIDKPLLVEQGVAEDQSADPFLGKQIDDYRILERIGTGGMGAVYLAERLNSDFKQRVALKIIKRGMDTDAILRRFARERKILSTLKHPNIAQLLDGGISNENLPFFVMEFVDGKPLDQFCTDENLALEKRLKIFRQICAAVEHAHKNLIVHRDLKPSNILVTDDGIPKLLDFGIAKLLSDEDAEITITQSKMFTPEYASPEQILGRTVTTATDVYSLGVILYQILSGHRPFDTRGKSYDEIIKSVCETEPPRPSETLENQNPLTATEAENFQIPKYKLRGDLDNIVLKALRKEPSERYGSVRQFSEDVGRFLEGLPVTARPQTLKYRFEKYFNRHKVGVLTAVLVLFSLITGVSIAVWQAIVARRERARAEQRFAQVRQFANTVLFDYYERIKEMPGATDVREKMVKDALAYLDNLAGESDYSIELQRELAQAYRKVGDIQGGTSTSANLGNSQAALESYRKALAIQQKVVAANPENIEDRRLLGSLMLDLAGRSGDTGDQPNRLDYARNAVNALRKLAGDFPDDAKSRSDLARALWTLAGALRSQGNADDALAGYREAVDIYENLYREKPDERKYLRNAALTYKNMGGIYEEKRDAASALEFYRKALAIDKNNAEAEPNNVTSQMDLSFSYGSIATALRWSGDKNGALENFRQKLAIQEKVAAVDPKNAFAMNALGFTFQQIGDIQRNTNNFAEADANLKKSAEIFRKLTTNDQKNVIYKSRLADALTILAQIREKTGDRNAAEEMFREAIAIYKEMFSNAASVESYALNFADTYLFYARFLLAGGKTSAALENYREAARVLESKSNKKGTEEQMAMAYEGIADAHVLQNQTADAAEFFRKSLELFQQLKQNGNLSVSSSNEPEIVKNKLENCKNNLPADNGKQSRKRKNARL